MHRVRAAGVVGTSDRSERLPDFPFLSGLEARKRIPAYALSDERRGRETARCQYGKQESSEEFRKRLRHLRGLVKHRGIRQAINVFNVR